MLKYERKEVKEVDNLSCQSNSKIERSYSRGRQFNKCGKGRHDEMRKVVKLSDMENFDGETESYETTQNNKLHACYLRVGIMCCIVRFVVKDSK